MRAFSAFVVVFFLATASGCLGRGGAKTDPSPTETDPYALPPGVTNVLQGQVVGVDFTPLSNATVEILNIQENRTTDELGEYRFENLEPRDYLVAVSIEGYRTKTQRAIIEDGKIFELNFNLEERPLQEPYSEVFPWTGLISCQLAYSTNPEAIQHYNCGSADPNNQNAKEFSFPGLGAQLVVEAFWQPNQDAAKKLQLQVESVGFGHQDIIFGQAVGETGLKMPISQSLMQKYYPQGGTVRVTLSAAPTITGQEDGFDAGFAVQQRFDVYVTLFYVEPGPANYSAKVSPGG